MKKFDTHEAKKHIIGLVRHGSLNDLEKDERGQLIVYTDLYMWKDGSIHDQPEEKE